MADSANGAQADTGSGPELQSLSLLRNVQLTGSATYVPLIVDETSSSRIDEIKIQLDRPIQLVQQEVGGMGHGIPPLVPVTTDTIDAFLPTEYHAFTPGTFFDLTSDGVSFRNLMFGAGAGGTYAIEGITLTDHAGNSSQYSAADLAKLGLPDSFSVTPDTAGPVLTKLILPTSYPVLGDEPGQTAAVGYLSLSVTDPSGSSAVSGIVHLLAPDGGTVDVYIPDPHSMPATFRSGAVTTGSAQLNAAGLYNVVGVDVADTSGNNTHYSAADLAAGGFATSFAVLQEGSPQPTGFFAVDGSAGQDTIQLNGNVNDYVLSRANLNYDAPSIPARLGDFVLTATNGSGVYSIDGAVDTVGFQNGQYLALHELPAYISGSDALSIGGAKDDILYQSRLSGYEAFRGGDGVDQLYLYGNINDYTVRSTNAEFTGDRADFVVSGLELVSRNGSGALFIDASVETVHFQSGQYLAYRDIRSYVDAATPDPTGRTYLVLPDGLATGSLVASGSSNSDNWLLLDGNVSDFSLTRGSGGSFILSGDGMKIDFGQSINTVQFGNGQFLALRDLPSYIAGDPTYSTGTSSDDLLFLPLSGDQYISGGKGVDELFVHGNTYDYSLQSISVGATVYHPVIQGYELVASNGSGNIYIDHSTETVHFQNGQYLAFQDLPVYIH